VTPEPKGILVYAQEMSHDRSLRAPVWKAIFEVFAVSLIPTIIANRAQPKYVPWWLVVICLVVALIALAMWMHDGGYMTTLSSRIDEFRWRKIERVRAIVQADLEQRAGAENDGWRTSHIMTTWGNGYTMGIWLWPPNASQGQNIGVVNATCKVLHVGHGEYRVAKGTANGDMGLSAAFPHEFQALTNSPALGWPLPEGEYQIDWTGMTGYASRQRFTIDKNGREI
jgi:hypothetical protein